MQDLDTGKRHEIDRWADYNVSMDLFSSSMTFSATLAAIDYQRQFTSPGGQRFNAFSYGAIQSTGLTDERSEAYNTTQTDLKIQGRGPGGLLLDSAVASNRLSMYNLTLDKVVDRITEPFQPDWITSIVTNNASNRYLVAGGASGGSSGATKQKNDLKTDAQGNIFYDPQTPKVKRTRKRYKPFGKNSPQYRGTDTESLKQTRIQPGEKVWEVITRLCKQIAVHPYVACDGALILMRPTYDFQSSAYGDGIQCTWDKTNSKATGGNVFRGQFETSIQDRCSEIVAWGSGKPRKTSMGKELLKHTWSVKDPGPAFWKRVPAPTYLGENILPKQDLVKVKNIKDEKMIRRICRGMFEERVIRAFSLEYQIFGHKINNVLPVVDSMIRVDDDRFNLHDVFYITKVQRRYNMSEGKTTVLTLIPPKIWLHFDHDSTGDAEYLEHMVQRVFW